MNAKTADVVSALFARLVDQHGNPRLGAIRFLQILLTEAVFTIWKLRNRRVIDRTSDDQERAITRQEAVGALEKILNRRLSDDKQLTNKFKYGNRALSRVIVASTWCGVLLNEANLPSDWTMQSGVLVGLSNSRPTG